MKNISSILIFFSPLFFAAASYGVDSIAYGDWNAAETWKNGDIPPADSTGSGVLCQNACDDTNFFYFNRDSAAGAINAGWSDGNYIMKSLNEDAVFTLYGTNSSNGVIKRQLQYCRRSGNFRYKCAHKSGNKQRQKSQYEKAPCFW